VHILSLEDDSYNHVKFDTLCKDRQSFHGLSNSTLLAKYLLMLHSCSIFWSYHPCYNWTKRITSTSSCSMCLRLEKNEYIFSYVDVFQPTEPMHLIFTLSYKQDTLQSMGGDSRFPNFYKWRFWICQTKIKTQHQDEFGRRRWHHH
jgi:hypothetical protein